jgi:hypothetical protein
MIILRRWQNTGVRRIAGWCVRIALYLGSTGAIELLKGRKGGISTIYSSLN